METLSEILSPYDNLEIVCEEHGILCLGLCSNYLCEEKVKFLCMKCIKSGQTCITKQKHELITLSEMLYRFFIKEENKSIDLLEIQEMNQMIRDYNKEELNNVINQFKNIKEESSIKMDQIRKAFIDVINHIIQMFKQKNNEKINELKDVSKNKIENEKDINFLLGIKMPEVDKKSMDNNQKMIDFMNNGYKLSSPKNFINSVKFLNDSNNFIETSTKLNKLLYSNEVSSTNDEKKKKLEQKIDSILDELEIKFDEKMEKIESEIIISKSDPSIYSNVSTSSKFKTDPRELVYKEDICSSAHKNNSIDKVFCAFKAFSGESIVAWGTPQYNIEIYDLSKSKIVHTILRAHNQTIFSCRHYPDSKKRIDYLITSSYDRTVKVWDLKTYSYVVNILNAHSGYYIYSVSILCDSKENANYVITSAPNEYMKVWDFNGKNLRSMGQNDESTYFIDTYYDSRQKKHYVINANSSDVKSYDFSTGHLYFRYKGTPQTWHMSALVNDTKDQQILIESDGNGYIRMWDFHTAALIKTISSSPTLNLRGVCLWNDDYLFSAGNDYQVKLFDLTAGKFVKSYKGHSSTVCSVAKIDHPKYGECLISHGLEGKLKIWVTPQKS